MPAKIGKCLKTSIIYKRNQKSFFDFSRTNPISMFFQLRELEQWLGLNVVEIWVNLVSLTVFSVLLVLKLEILYHLTWWQVFSPLFISDALNCYFCTIVWIRMYVEGPDGKINRFVILILLNAFRIARSERVYILFFGSTYF